MERRAESTRNPFQVNTFWHIFDIFFNQYHNPLIYKGKDGDKNLLPANELDS